MPDQVPNHSATTVPPSRRKIDDVSASLDSLSRWIDEHQKELETRTKIIHLDSKQGNIYSFKVAFLIFVLNGDVDLSTNNIANGNFYVTAPVWGPVDMMESISGNLDGSIACQFDRGPNIKGKIVLSLDKTTKKLTIEYDFTVKFVGHVTDKLRLFTLPSFPKAPSVAQIAAAQPTTLICDTYTYGHKLFDQFLEDHYDPNTKNFVVMSFNIPQSRALDGGDDDFVVNVSSLGGVLELEGFVDLKTLAINATLYVRVPLWGRVQISAFLENLKDGVSLNINELVAQGTVVFTLVNGSVVRADVNLHVQFVGDLTDNSVLFNLPQNSGQKSLVSV